MQRKDLDPKKDGRYKGCTCTPLALLEGLSTADGPGDWRHSLAAWESGYSTDNLVPTCQRSPLAAAQRPSDNADRNVAQHIDSFCANQLGRGLTRPDKPGPPLDTWDIVASKGWVNHTHSYWLSANLVLDADPKIGCATNTTISAAECKRMLNFAMNYCDPNSGETHGASIKTDCIAYNITLDAQGGSSGSEQPPWNRNDPWLLGMCVRNSGGNFSTHAWKPIYHEFCYYQGNTTAPNRNFMAIPNEWTYTEEQGAADPAQLSFWYVPTPGENVCYNGCAEAYRDLAFSVCGDSGGKGVLEPSGSIDIGCGKYFYTAQGATGDEVRCLIDDYAYVGLDPTLPPLVPSERYSSKDADIAIKLFCTASTDLVPDTDAVQGEKDVSMLVDPNASHAPDGWMSQEPDYPERLYFFPKTLQVITVSAAFASVVGRANQHPSWGRQSDFPTNEQCNPNHPAKRFSILSYKQDCMNALSKAVNLCNQGQETYISGGYTMQHSAEYGCVIWKLYAFDTDVNAASVPTCIINGDCRMVRPDGALALNATHEEVTAVVREHHPHLRGG